MALVDDIKTKAISYLNETDIDNTEPMTTFPTSIVDFVMEYAYEQCHFPKHFTEAQKQSALTNCKCEIAMACVDIYLKAGSEGQTNYTSNSVQRTYKNEWITKSLLQNLPNYVTSI